MIKYASCTSPITKDPSAPWRRKRAVPPARTLTHPLEVYSSQAFHCNDAGIKAPWALNIDCPVPETTYTSIKIDEVQIPGNGTGASHAWGKFTLVGERFSCKSPAMDDSP